MAKNRLLPNIKQLRVALARREQAVRIRDVSSPEKADALWEVWKDASRYSTTADGSWSAGRDAATFLLGTARHQAGVERLGILLIDLQQHGLHRHGASCLDRALPYLESHDLLELLLAVDPSQAFIRVLPAASRERITAEAQRHFDKQPEAASASLLGRLLAIESPMQPEPTIEVGERSLEARALRQHRWQGAETAIGIGYEAQYALWRLLEDEGIIEIDLQDLEDIGIVHLLPDGSRLREHVQVKKRDAPWSVPDLQGAGKGANKVFDSFAEVALVEPQARLTFATNSRLESGKAPRLLQAVQKLHTQVSSSGEIDALLLAQAEWTSEERAAVNQLQQNMRPDLLEQIDLVQLLARTTFDTGHARRGLRDATVRRISARLRVPDQEAENAYHAFIGELVEAMGARKQFSRSEIDEMMERSGVLAGAFRSALEPIGSAEILDFESEGTAVAERFYQGYEATPANVAAGLDAIRPRLMVEISQALDEARCCIIRAPSGQGKTTLMYRFAFEVRNDLLIVRLHKLDQASVSDLIRAITPLARTEVLVLIDDLASGGGMEWPRALKRLLEHEHVRVLATSREDDWRVTDAASLQGVVRFVRPALDEGTAEAVFAALQELDGVILHADHWLEPLQQSNGLLIEYVHILTQGDSIRHRIAEQIAHLEHSLSSKTDQILGALRFISAAHAYGGYLTRATLNKLVSAGSDLGLGRTLRILEEEFWVRQSGGHYVGLHQVRSRVVTSILHEHDPLSDTIERLLAHADISELEALLETLLYEDPLVHPRFVADLAERAKQEGVDFGLRVATAAYAADERQYADAVFATLMARDTPPRQTQLFFIQVALAPSNLTDAALERWLALLPEPSRSELRDILDALPRRDMYERLEGEFLDAIGSQHLTAWLLDATTPEDGARLLWHLSIARPELGRAVLEKTGLEALAELVLGSAPAVASNLLAAIREIDLDTAVCIEASARRENLLLKAVAEPEACFAARIDGTAVKGRFLTSLALSEEAVNDQAVRLTTFLYGLFPTAIESEITGSIHGSAPHPAGVKTIPRANLPAHPYRAIRSQFWISLCVERSAAGSLRSNLEQHDDYGQALVRVLHRTQRILDAARKSAWASIDVEWLNVNQQARYLSHAPHQTPQLSSVLKQGGIKDVFAGSQRIDTNLLWIGDASVIVRREIGNYFSSRPVNGGVLIEQLARIEREIAAYGGSRHALLSMVDLDSDWPVHLQDAVARLRVAMNMLVISRVGRLRDPEAGSLYEQFSELRALAKHLMVDAVNAQATDTVWENGIGQVSALHLAMKVLKEHLTGWEPFELLAQGVDGLSEAASDLGNADSPSGGLLLARSRLSRVSNVLQIDVEAWLSIQRDERDLEEHVRQLSELLTRRGVFATCHVLPVTLDQPLTRSVGVVVKPADLRDLSQIRETVGTEVFASSLGHFRHVVLLVSLEDGRVLPFAFERWRRPKGFVNPYDEINPLSPWTSIEEVSEVANQLRIAVDDRRHPIQESYYALRESQARCWSILGRLHAVVLTIHDGTWTLSHSALGDEVQEFLRSTFEIDNRVQVLVREEAKYPNWAPIVSFTIHLVGNWFAWVTSIVTGSVADEEIRQIAYEQSEVESSVQTMVYQGEQSRLKGTLTTEQAMNEYKISVEHAINAMRQISIEVAA